MGRESCFFVWLQMILVKGNPMHDVPANVRFRGQKSWIILGILYATLRCIVRDYFCNSNLTIRPHGSNFTIAPRFSFLQTIIVNNKTMFIFITLT